MVKYNCPKEIMDKKGHWKMKENIKYYKNWELIIRGEVFEEAYITRYPSGFGVFMRFDSKHYKTYRGAYNYLVKHGYTPKEIQ